MCGECGDGRLVVLEHFFDSIASDVRIAPRHIAVFTALVLLRTRATSHPFLIIREEIMRMAKIRSRHTYHRSLRELHEYGYIQYLPSHEVGQTRVGV